MRADDTAAYIVTLGDDGRTMRGLSNLRLLLVEDDREVRRSTTRFLERMGHKVTTCGSVRDALATDDTFDCLVLDIDLPDGNGVSLAEELLDRGSSSLVVFYSGSLDRVVGQRALALGPFIPKSSGALELTRTIADLVSQAACELAATANTPTSYSPRPSLSRSGPRRKAT